ncbi:hypothetical protein GJ496_010612 [Pomphorhynchus laevis]|nr:hypothetical protein GJ496_010612 [Pomphorhynchus laevis]
MLDSIPSWNFSDPDPYVLNVAACPITDWILLLHTVYDNPELGFELNVKETELYKMSNKCECSNCDQVEGTLIEVIPGPTTRSIPPMRLYDMTLSEAKCKCGECECIQENIQFRYKITSHEPPEFDLGSKYRVDLKKDSQLDKLYSSNIVRI